MSMLEQILITDNKSLGVIRKVLSSEAMKLKREIKEISPHHRNYLTMVNNRKRAYEDVLEAREDYGLMK